MPATLSDATEATEDEVYVLGLRERSDDESWSLLFMQAYRSHGEQEIRLGMDTYCLVVDPGQHVAYGGFLECELSHTRLRLLLAGHTAGDLGLHEETSFTLALTRGQLALVRRGLTKVLTSGRPGAVPQTLDVHP